MFIAVVSLRPMFSQLTVDTNDNNPLGAPAKGRWCFAGEQKKFRAGKSIQRPDNVGAFLYQSPQPPSLLGKGERGLGYEELS